ncbi:MAG: OB-fold nucleic acid binding domain-containing protein [Candidatus Nanohaloarchaea archaeon]|nr:OB-fold nucleic acid binding domain-containing protein [Candidatus Nanohaloarchaea archaeon]
MADDRTRMTARRARLEDVVNGSYNEREGFDPDFIVTPRGMRISRVSVIGTVVDSFVNDDETYGALTIDDGTETLRVKFFKELDDMEDVEEGDIVEVVGKVRKYDGELYVNPELLKKREFKDVVLHSLEVEDLRRKWMDRVEKAEEMQGAGKTEEDIRQEISGGFMDVEDVDAILEFLSADNQFETAGDVESSSEGSGSVESDTGAEDAERAVLDAVERLDDGEGVDYSALIEELDFSEEEIESVINDMLSDGTCYEPKPGKVKKL